MLRKTDKPAAREKRRRKMKEDKMKRNNAKTKTVLVVFGGCSTEYDVSLQSASAVIRAIDRTEYRVLTMGITREGEWYLYEGQPGNIENNTWREGNIVRAFLTPDRNIHGIAVCRQDGIIFEPVDVVFPVLHGKNGEDGTLQGLCELAGIPCVGPDMLGSAICMNKELAHHLVEDAGIRVPKAVVLQKGETKDQMAGKLAGLKYPVFVKPVRAGSSFGISKVNSEVFLEDAIRLAFEHDREVIIEENIEGFEVGCAIMGNRELVAGRVDEIELADGFFDYTEKYTLKTSRIHMPARISKETEERIKWTGMKIYRVLGLKDYSRVDMFLMPDGEIVFNEVNTIPGFTAHSRFPSMMKGIGYGFEQIVDRLIKLALK